MQRNQKEEEYKNKVQNLAKNNLFESGIVVPPGCDNQMLRDSGEKVSTYIPSTYRPYVQMNNKNMIPHVMNGKTGGISVPKSGDAADFNNMADYLSKYTGAYLCLDLWTKNHTKIKKCGILLEVGKNLIIVKESNPNKVSIIDLTPIYYISIYCKRTF